MSVKQAIETYGGRYKFAKDMEITWSAVDRWYKSGVVPVDQCAKAAKMLGVPAASLNPKVAKVFA